MSEEPEQSETSESLSIDVFWSFRSPWSYLATPRLAEWQRRYQLEVRLRPVYPIAIRTPEFFDNIHPLWPRYFMVLESSQSCEIESAWTTLRSTRPDDPI